MPNFKIYQKFDAADIVSGKTNIVSTGLFPGNEVSFTQSLLRTSSVQTQQTGSNGTYDVLNGTYYTNVYDDSVTSPELLFSISYGDANGGGVKTGSIFNNTKAVYSQYKNLLLGSVDQDGRFSFKTGSSATATYITSSDIFVLSFGSTAMRDQIDKGQWTFTISGSNGSSSLSLIDEYPLLSTSEKKEQRLVYQIVSGSYSTSTGQTVAVGDYQGLGAFYPKNGIMILNASKIQSLAGHIYNNTTASTIVNHQSLFTKLRGAGSALMRVRRSEIIPSTHYFVRVKNQDFNFSNNPSFVHQTTTADYSRGEIITPLQSDPKTYVTTIGLYNDMNELVAVAKLSRPTKKDFVSELGFRIRLDF